MTSVSVSLLCSIMAKLLGHIYFITTVNAGLLFLAFARGLFSGVQMYNFTMQNWALMLSFNTELVNKGTKRGYGKNVLDVACENHYSFQQQLQYKKRC